MTYMVLYNKEGVKYKITMIVKRKYVDWNDKFGECRGIWWFLTQVYQIQCFVWADLIHHLIWSFSLVGLHMCKMLLIGSKVMCNCSISKEALTQSGSNIWRCTYATRLGGGCSTAHRISLLLSYMICYLEPKRAFIGIVLQIVAYGTWIPTSNFFYDHQKVSSTSLWLPWPRPPDLPLFPWLSLFIFVMCASSCRSTSFLLLILISYPRRASINF